MLNKKALAASLSATAAKVYVEDVFATSSYRGTNATLTITNDIDLSGKGGLVWTKIRSGTTGHRLTDTARGATKSLESNSTTAEATESAGLTAFNSDGFTIGTDADYNVSGQNYVAWTFRKQAKFFDVVTYTGNGSSSRAITHNLGSTPGCVIVKRTDSTGRWKVYHRSDPTKNGNLNDTSAFDSNDSNMFFQGKISAVSSTTFTVESTTTGGDDVNGNTYTYVAYLFAHDAGGFGDAGTDNVISCGSYSSATAINLGWEPQWLLVKSSTVAPSSWYIINNMTGFTTAAFGARLIADLTNAEGNDSVASITSTGFNSQLVDGAGTYIYIAIRRGPMKTPTDATKVFTPTVYTGTNVDNRRLSTTITPDFVMIRQRNDAVVPGMYTGARLTGQEYMLTGSNVAGATDADSFDADNPSVGGTPTEFGNAWSLDSTIVIGNDATRKFNANTTSNNHIIHAFKRAPGFFDVVCYTGTGSNTTISHNLGVAPEMMIIKKRSTTGSPSVYHASVGNTKYMELNSTAVPTTSSTYWNNTTPTSSVFSLGTNTEVNGNGSTYIAFLFASCSGISKVGTFTGSGNVDCGFANGARYILIKKTSAQDETSMWHVFDTARGIVAASDPVLWLNETTAESTAGDYVDPLNAGFSTTAYWSGDFVYLAIA